MNDKIWNIPEAASIPDALLQVGCTPLLAAVLASRGWTDPEWVRDFLAAGPFLPSDPLAMDGMADAVARIRLARDRDEIVAVYGDYDVDGITAACLLTNCLTDLGIRTQTYIPDRLEEGYGVNAGAVRRLRDLGVTLMVTVDCGITAVAETDYARELGMDVIITDHHECQAVLPAAAAVVDPRRSNNDSPDRDLAGVGVAFKLVCALTGDGQAALDRYADLVAVGTVADVMPLMGENRRIVKLGLEKLRKNPRPGLAALMEQSGVSIDRLSANTLGFSLAPRINAAGRLGRVRDAVALVLEQDPDRALQLAESLCEMNRQRQQLEAEIWEQAVDMLAGTTPTGPIVLAREGWHQGVIGIVASRLADAYQLPTVMISLEGDKGKGSCRSWGGFNLFDALAACEDCLESFGGHAMAAGLNITRDRIDDLRRALGEYYVAHIPQWEERLCPDVNITDPGLLTMECVASLEKLEPCGNANPRPLLCLTDALLTAVIPIGGGRHVRLQLERFGQRYDCVWFSMSAAALGVSVGDRVDVAFCPQVSEYRGRRSVQLMMSAIRRTDLESLCRNILQGGAIGEHRLDRRELGWLWRALSNQCPCRIKLSRLSSLEGRLRPPQIALGLRVLEELALARVRLEGPDVHVMLMAWEDKTDLNNSPSWRAQAGSR